MKLIQIISEHNEKNHPGQKGMVEAIVRLPDGKLVTRHVFRAHLDGSEIDLEPNKD